MSEDTEKVVELANVYVKAGENFINAIKKAQDEIEKEEREKYEGNGCLKMDQTRGRISNRKIWFGIYWTYSKKIK